MHRLFATFPLAAPLSADSVRLTSPPGKAGPCSPTCTYLPGETPVLRRDTEEGGTAEKNQFDEKIIWPEIKCWNNAKASGIFTLVWRMGCEQMTRRKEREMLQRRVSFCSMEGSVY